MTNKTAPESVSNEKEIQCIEKQENELRDEMSASEAVFGFCAWLTGREELVVFLKNHNSDSIDGLIKEFCKINELAKPRKTWINNLVFPKEKE